MAYIYDVDSKRYTTYTAPTSRVFEKLAPGIYELSYNPLTSEVSFTEKAPYELPGKIYGNAISRADRILTTHEDFTDRNTGVLLIGDAGSGKSLLAKVLANRFVTEVADGVVITFAQPYKGSLLERMLSDIKQPCLVLIDEFEKFYDRDDQKALLTVMDGGSVVDKLFVLTANDEGQVNRHIMNRPGRAHYCYRYHGLDEAFVRDYAAENIADKTQIEELVLLSYRVPGFSFDILKALISEANRFKETVMEAATHLNILIPAQRQEMEIWHLSRVTFDGVDMTHLFEVARIYEDARRYDDSMAIVPLKAFEKDVPPMFLNLDTSYITETSATSVTFSFNQRENGEIFKVVATCRKGFEAKGRAKKAGVGGQGANDGMRMRRLVSLNGQIPAPLKDVAQPVKNSVSA